VTKRGRSSSPSLPSEQQILEFIQSSGGTAGKREISRAFGLKGADRIPLKQMLKDMADRGVLAKRRRRVVDAGTLPSVAVLEVVKIDADGEIVGEPVEWDEETGGKRPRVLISSRQAKGARPEMQPPGRGDRVLAKIEPQHDRHFPYTATIIRKLNERGNRILGIFRPIRGHGARIIPVDKKARQELHVLPGDEAEAAPGELVEAEIVRDRGRGLLTARVRERLGDLNDQRNISLIAIHQHGIPVEFPERVIEETARLKPFAHGNRTDIRHVPLITIDPRDARDHDDAVWAEPAEDGGVNIIVAIADVATYVRPQTALDREARIRGNSVYFPDRVVPMLPERISNDLCSLREKQDRPALACYMHFDKTGTKKSHRFERVIMRSHAKLAYEDAQAAIDGRLSLDVTEPILKPLWAAYDVLMTGRKRRDPLELDLPERRLVLDAHGLIERVVTPERLDAHKLIEEFMIQANVAAAEELEKRKTPLLYRVHDVPSDEKLRALGEFLQTINLSLSMGQAIRPKHFNKILEQVKNKDYQHLVHEVVLRTQAQAVYSPENNGHFGLALRRYAHFTSPIRRYADLIVHRALVSALGLGEDGLSPEDIAKLDDTAQLISGAERRAMAAERETVDRLIAHHLANQVGAVFPARIGGVVGAGLFVTLSDSGADGFIPVSSLGVDYFVLDETRHALIGERTGETFQLGDRVEVKLVEAAPVTGGLRFEMVSEGRAGKAMPRRAMRGRRMPSKGSGKGPPPKGSSRRRR
jgi:ribonuclease R